MISIIYVTSTNINIPMNVKKSSTGRMVTATEYRVPLQITHGRLIYQNDTMVFSHVDKLDQRLLTNLNCHCQGLNNEIKDTTYGVEWNSSQVV